MEEDNPLGLGYTPTIGDAFEGAVNYLGGVARFYQKSVPQFLTGVRRGIKEEAETPVTPATGVESVTKLPQEYARTESRFLEQVASGVEALGLPEPVAGAAALAVSPFLPGLAEMSLVTKGGAATLMGLTVTDPRFIAKGVAEGVGQSELYKAGVQKLRKLQTEGIVKRKLYQEQFDTGVINEKQLKSRLQKLKKREDANYSTLGTVEDPDIFEVQSQIQRDPIDPSLPAHQHHAAGKAMTSPWVQQVLKLGDNDDVVAFFELHRMLTGSGMGNVKSGIIDMPGFAHIPRDARTPADVPMAVHSFMKKSGADIEILSSRVEKIIGNPKNMDELMEKYATFAAEYLIPQKELSLKRLNQVLTEHRRTLSPEQIKTFDDLVSKLNKANT